MNPYDVLNVRDNATKQDIDKAYAFYKQKYNAKDYSGDKLYAIKRMTDIDAAYRVLSNPQLRSAFDNRYNTHVKSHVSKKDAFKEYYVDDPIGTHEHHDFEMAMKKFESKKSLFDFQKSAIKTYGDEIFDSENIRDYSEFTSKKAQTKIKKFVIFMLIAYFACMFLFPVFSMFVGFGDLLNDMWDNFQLEKEQESYYDESTTQDINYGYPQDNSNDYDSTPVRQEQVAAVSVSGELKAYSVVCGSFSLQANAQGLKDYLIGEGYKAGIVKNVEKNMFRVIIGSYDTKADAARARESFKQKYPSRADFQGSWILLNK